jgi:hypothetical protein
MAAIGELGQLRSQCIRKFERGNDLATLAAAVAAVCIYFFTGSFIGAICVYLGVSSIGYYCYERLGSDYIYHEIAEALSRPGFRRHLEGVAGLININSIRDLYLGYKGSFLP